MRKPLPLSPALALLRRLNSRRMLRAMASCSANNTTILHADTPANAELIRACPAFAEYRPTAWLPGPHLNTIGSALLRQPPPSFSDGRRGAGLTYAKRTVLPVSHGGQVSLDWHTLPLPRQPVLLVLHGLTGGSHETYVQWLVHHAACEGGMAVVVMNARGCGGNSLTSARCFSAAWTEDVRVATCHIRSIIGSGTPLFHIGFSLGAGILAKFIGEEGERADSWGAVAVAGAFDLQKSSVALESGLNHFLYNGMLCRSLQRFYDRHAHVFSTAPWADAGAVASSRTVRQFDSAAIVPQFAYRDVDHYYHDASAGKLLHAVRVPLLTLNALDDPICAAAGILDRADVIRSNPHVISVLTPSGGHVAWATGSGSLFLGLAWDNVASVQFFRALLARRGYAWDSDVTSKLESAVPVPLPVVVGQAREATADDLTPTTGSGAGKMGRSVGGIEM